MLSFIRLTLFHAKRILKNMKFIGMTLIFPIVFIALFGVIFNGSDDITMTDLLVVNESDFVSESVISEMNQDGEIFIDNREEAIEQLEQGKISIVYTIPKNFPEEPITAHSLNGSNRDYVFENEFTSALLTQVENQVLEEHGIPLETVDVAAPSPKVEFSSNSFTHSLYLIGIFILIYMSFGAGITSTDLQSLRSQNVLKRSISANSSSWLVLGSVLSGYTLATLVTAFLSMVAGFIMLDIDFSYSLQMLPVLFAMAVFLSGLSIFIFRYVKTQELTQIIASVAPIALLILTYVGIMVPVFDKIQLISPFYYLFKVLDTGVYLPYIPIVILMGIILFTAGSFKVEHLLAKK